MSSEAVRYVLAQTIKPAAIKFYLERVAYRIDNRKGFAWPSQSTIAKEMSVSARTVRKYQEECIRRELLRSRCQKNVGGRFTSNRYEIPGLIDWLSDQNANPEECYERARAATPWEGGGPTAEANTGGTRGADGRGNTGGLRSVGTRGAYKKNKRKETGKEMDEQRAARPASALSLKKKANRADDEASGYRAFCDDYKAALKAAGKSDEAKGLADGRKVWLSISQADRGARRRALNGYRADLSNNDFKNPQHIDRFLETGWEDFAVDEQAANAEEERKQVQAVALDLHRNEFNRGRKWWPAIDHVPGKIRLAALDLIAKEQWEPYTMSAEA